MQVAAEGLFCACAMYDGFFISKFNKGHNKLDIDLPRASTLFPSPGSARAATLRLTAVAKVQGPKPAPTVTTATPHFKTENNFKEGPRPANLQSHLFDLLSEIQKAQQQGCFSWPATRRPHANTTPTTDERLDRLKVNQLRRCQQIRIWKLSGTEAYWATRNQQVSRQV